MTFALPPKLKNPTKYSGDSIASIPAVNFPRAPLTRDRNYPLFTIWRNSNAQAVSPDAEGDCWLLVRFQATVTPNTPPDAIWKKISTGSTPGGTVLSLSDTIGTKVMPDGLGNIQLVGGAGINVVSTPASNLLTFSLAGGGTAIDQIAVDAGVSPVVADGAGQITATATQIATGIIPANAIRTNGTGVNTMAIEIQRSTAVAATDSTKNGVSHYSSAQFGVDGNGFVTLSGGAGPAILTLTGDTGGALGPTAGNFNILGQAVPNTSGIKINGAGSTLNATMFSPFVGNFTFTNATSTTARVVVVENTDTNAASIAEFQTLVAAASTADSYINTAIGAVRSYAFGIDNSVAGDPLKITTQGDANASPSSASIILNSTPDGEVTLPLQPAFLGTNTSATNNITGAGAAYQLGNTALTITFDVNGDFNTNGTFTAPVTGKYSLGFNLFFTGITAAMTVGLYGIVTSNRTFTIGNNPSTAMDVNNSFTAHNFVFTDMDAADTAVVNMTISNGAGDTADLLADAQPWSSFFGQLEC